MKSKVKSSLKICLTIIIIITVIKGLVNSVNSADTDVGFYIGDWYIESSESLGKDMYENGYSDNFLNANSDTFLGKTMAYDLHTTDANGVGIDYPGTFCVQPGSGNQSKDSRQEIVNVVDYSLNENKMRIIGTETNEYEANLEDTDYEMMATIYYVSKATEPGFSGGHATDLNRYLIQNMFKQLWSDKKDYFHWRMGQGGVYNGYNYWSSDFEGKVKELALQMKNYKSLTQNTTNEEAEYTSKKGEIILGPFSINYDGKNIESVKIGNIIGNSNNTSTILWASSSNSDTWKKIKYTGKIKDWNDQEPLPQNEEFYLKVIENTNEVKEQDGKIKVTITQEGMEVTRARMITTVSVRTGKSTTGQGLVIFAADGEKGVSIEYTVGTPPPPPPPPQPTTPTPPPPSTPNKVSISGYVWTDKIQKGNVEQTENGTVEVTNSLYKEGINDTNDSLVPGVIVRLFKNGIQVGNSQTTDRNGNYKFDGNAYNILKSELNNYHIEFDYSGLTIDGVSGKKYIPVAYNVADSSGNLKQNASRALMSEISENDAELSGKATTYKGTDNSSYSFGTFAGNSVLFANNELKYINLGIKQIYEPDYELVEDLKYVKIVMNNHQYVYEYGSKQLPNIAAAPTVSFQSPSVNSYQRAVYPSAIYDLKEGKNTNGQLKVYVVYEMLIANVTEYQNEELYKEQELVITNLSNEFDSSRYEFAGSAEAVSVQGSNSEFVSKEDSIKADFDKWTVNGNKATYKNSFSVARGKAALKYIQFRVKDQEMLRILNNPDEGVQENRPTTASTNAYHQYTRKEYSWTTRKFEDVTHTTPSVTKYDNAPYLKFKLGRERIIKGTVFEDLVDMTGRQDGEVLGNGRYEKESEKAVQGVIIELVTDISKEEAIDVYVGSDDKKTYTIQKAKTTTNSNGEFEISGVMPGEYYIRLTYGDGTQKIMNSDGTVVSIDKYKSTIVTSEVVRGAISTEYGNNSYGNEWYKHLEADNYSVAVDDLEIRAKHNGGEEQTSMIAWAPKIDITIENTIENISAIVDNKEIFSGFNLGIIKLPKQELKIYKKIVDINLVNSTGNTILSGNPGRAPQSGLVDLDGISNNEGSLYTRMEMEETSIYGSKLTITYNIEVENVSDKNFYEVDEKHNGWYYWFGIAEALYSRQVEIDVNEVIDCYDQLLSLSIPNDSDNLEQITATLNDDGTKQWGSSNRNASVDIQTQELKVNSRTDDLTKYNFKDVLSITKWGTLAKDAKKSFEFEAYKLLSPDDNLEFLNIAGISDVKYNMPNELSNEQKEYAAKSQAYLTAIIYEAPSEIVEAIVVPPTGSNIPLLIVVGSISGIAVLSIIATSIVFIKRRRK